MLSSRQREFFESFAGPRATDRLVAGPVLLLLSFGTGISQDYVSQEVSAAWLGIAFQSFLVSMIVFFALGPLLAKIKKPTWLRTILIAVFYFVLEMIRALYVGFAALDLGLVEDVELTYRILAGGITGVLFFGVASIILNDTASYKKDVSELVSIREQINQSINDSKLGLQSKRMQISAQISEAVENALLAVLAKRKIETEAANKLAREFIRVSDEVVRPLSHSVYEGLETSKINTLRPIKLRFTRIIELIPDCKPFRAWPLILLASLLGLITAFFSASNPPVAILAVLIIVAWSLITLQFFERVVRPAIKNYSTAIRMAMVPLAYLILVGAPSALFIYLDEADISEVAGFLIYVIVVAQAVGAAIAFYPALERARAEVIDQLQELNDSYSWHLARLGSQLRMEEKQLARKLHKDVQGTLVASALKLQAEIAKGKPTAAIVKSIRAQLSKALSELTLVEKPKPLTTFVKELNAGWEPIFQLQLKLDQTLKKRIEQDQVCLAAIEDLAAEFVTNSVKHGEASHGEIRIIEKSAGVLEVSFENNGKPYAPESKPGLGSAIARSQIISGSYENLPNGVRFINLMAISDQ